MKMVVSGNARGEGAHENVDNLCERGENEELTVVIERSGKVTYSIPTSHKRISTMIMMTLSY